MAQHATLLERRVTTDGASTLHFSIEDDSAGHLGDVDIADAPIAAVKAALQKEAARLLALPVGTVIDL